MPAVLPPSPDTSLCSSPRRRSPTCWALLGRTRVCRLGYHMSDRATGVICDRVDGLRPERSSERALLLDLEVLVGREWAHPNICDRVLGDARADPHQGAKVQDRSVHDPVDRQLLDLVQDRLALGVVALGCLLPKQFVDVGIAAIGVGAL